MPIRVQKTEQAAQDYGSPFVGPVFATVQIAVALSGLTDREIDAMGVLKPGVPLTKAGALPGASPAFCYGVTVEPLKVAADNESATIAALGTIFVAVAVIAMVNRDAVEDILGEALTADEAASFDRAGSKLVLIG